ncbi:hypothetical protein QUE26_08195, partial [Lacticaseibacillus paracasei]|nr:hypothetical protein [Lacticaseibacillus paracasei]
LTRIGLHGLFGLVVRVLHLNCKLGKVIWIIQGLFYTNEVDAYVRLEPLIRRFYPFEIIYRRYYSLLVNWLPQKHVQLLLMNFLIDNLSTDDELNQFVAIALAKIEE